MRVSSIPSYLGNFFAPQVKGPQKEFQSKACHFPLLKGAALLATGGIAALIPGVSKSFSNLSLKAIVYEVSLAATRIFVGKEKWVSAVHETRSKAGKGTLYLTGIPLNDYGHVEDFKNKKIKQVVAMVEAVEQQSRSFGGNPVSKSQWSQAQIQQTLIQVEDFKPVPSAKIGQAVDIVHKTLCRGENVAVHCKAGKGRSATVVICYLLQYQKEEIGIARSAKIDKAAVAKAIAYVKKTRPHINLNLGQQQAVLDYFEWLKTS